MFTTIVIQPLYNALIYLVNLTPNQELWIALVILTIIFKIILVPLFKKQVKDQIIMAHINPELKKLQEKHKSEREILAKETMLLYKKYKVNPLLSILILFIQLPFIFGLYRIFYHDMSFYQNLLYSGVTYPTNINHMFFWFNLTEKSLILALIAGISQYILGAYMFNQSGTSGADSQSEMLKAMNLQMKYFLPVMIAVVSYFTPSVIALYMIVTNIFGIVQEIVIKKPLQKKVEADLNA